MTTLTLISTPSSRAMADKNTLQYPRKLKFAKRSYDIVERMRHLKEMCDVTFVVEEKKFHAHRVWLSASSPVVHKLLTNGMKESTQQEVTITEVSSDTCRRAMNFVCYLDVEIPTFDDAISLLKCANQFQFENLESSLDDFIAETLDTDSCFEILVAVLGSSTGS